MNLQPIAHTKRTEYGLTYTVTLYADLPDILKWLGAKAIRSKAGKSRALSGAIVVKAERVSTINQ